jgi:hypothetical protein
MAFLVSGCINFISLRTMRVLRAGAGSLIVIASHLAIAQDTILACNRV